MLQDLNPYKAPDAPASLPEPVPAIATRDPWAAAKALALAAALFVLAFLVARGSNPAAVVALGLSIAVAVVGVWRGIKEIAAPDGRGKLAQGFVVLLNAALALLGALWTFIATVGFTRGRQLRRRGRVLLPPVAPGKAWASVRTELEVPDLAGIDTAALAMQWRENGRTEHASVAAFARLTLDLLALGAPPDLVADANEDALDEIRHTEMCFSLARALDGRSESPGPFPEASRARTLPSTRVFALAQLAVDSLVDGALHEGLSARIIAKLARRCEVPAIRAALKEIAADEGRHAAHAWHVVLWCVEEGGAPVVSALEGSVSVLAATVRSPLPEAAQSGAWERAGIHGRALEEESYAVTRADLVARVAELRSARHESASVALS